MTKLKINSSIIITIELNNIITCFSAMLNMIISMKQVLRERDKELDERKTERYINRRKNNQRKNVCNMLTINLVYKDGYTVPTIATSFRSYGHTIISL